MGQTKEQRILKQLSGGTVQKKSAIATDMFLPNHSGDHSAGIVNSTPTNDTDLPNKKYVDDAIDTDITTHINTAQAHSDYLLNNASDTMTGTLTASGFKTFGSLNFSNNAYLTYYDIDDELQFTGATYVFDKDIIIDTDSAGLQLGADQDANIRHDGSNLLIDVTSGSPGGIYCKSTTGGTFLYQGNNNAIVRVATGTAAGLSGFYLTNSYLSPTSSSASSFGMLCDTTKDQMTMFVADNVGNQVNITNIANRSAEHGHATQTNPTLYIHSDTSLTSDSTQWISMTHDKTDAVITSGKGAIRGNGAFASGTMTVTTGTYDALDVAGVNTIFVDTSGGNVTIGGTVNGVDGQMLCIAVHDKSNNTTLEHEEGANQDFVLHAEADEVMTAEYGGWVFVNEGGNHWHDCSHAKHV